MTGIAAHPLEKIPPGEAELIAKLQKMQLLFMKRDESQRGQHPKSTGLVRASFSVRSDLPKDLAVGLFARPKEYNAVMRFSNGGGFDDRQNDARGIGLKLFDVEGEHQVPELGGASTHDFTLVNCPVFFCESVEQLLGFMQAQLKARGELPTAWFAENPRAAAAFQRFVSAPPASLLSCDYFSTTPFLLGKTAVKYYLRSQSPPVSVAPASNEDALRDGLFAGLAKGAARFEFGVQCQKDPAEQPVEDPSVEWKTPKIALADLVIAAGQTDSQERHSFAETLVITPWRTLASHRPLGGINRARLPIYAASSDKRHKVTGASPAEPAFEDVPQ